MTFEGLGEIFAGDFKDEGPACGDPEGGPPSA